MHDDQFFQKNKLGDHVASIFDDLAGFTYFIKDTKLRYVAFNQRLKLIFNVDHGSEILGKTDADFMPEHIMLNIRADDLNILNSEKPILNRIELVPTGNGFVDWSATNKKPLYTTEGKLCGIVGVTRPFNQSNATLSQNRELGPALEMMHRSFRDNIPIEHLASSTHLSRSTFQRKFKGCFGMTAKEYLRHLKVQEACHKISQTTMTFADISYHCGFADQSHFSREFTRIMKEPPSSYRARYRIN
ncbi:helix-turn-helix transcriptional regulator [Verrucomicrobiaceae bacterium N1E253]|uniref:Helix-turn-helix transcriptional regulator n=1 Tax=Oceaniferula marina TaxID=2748318 RepID=A0A851GFR5_9BACT|nr:AraC family transcriptional regulator [Oceaniferula marina]NWK54621.1 helix-turn-helix transcriptional regulator [Oceaniferula marina]